MINPRPDSGAHFESERRGPQVEDKHYIYANGEVVALHVQTHPASQSANITATTRYLHSDHLGSIVAIADEAGQLRCSGRERPRPVYRENGTEGLKTNRVRANYCLISAVDCQKPALLVSLTQKEAARTHD